MRNWVIVGAFVTTLVTGPSALAQEPPFGLQWGDDLSSLPQASQISEMGNITTLFYEQDHLPAGFRDIEQVVLKLCKNTVCNKRFRRADFFRGKMRGDNLHLPTPKRLVDTGDRMMVIQNAAPHHGARHAGPAGSSPGRGAKPASNRLGSPIELTSSQ